MQKFIIVVPVHNSAKYIRMCLDSILSQEHKNYEVMIVDDHSDDGTWDIINSYPFNSFRNHERIGSGLANIVKGIDLMKLKPEDIIVTVDGDDYLAFSSTLTHLDEVYSAYDVWMTYGQYFPLSGIYKDFNEPVENTATYRKSGLWHTSHLRTFKKHLWDRIDKKDLLNSKGEYFKVAWDRAFMYPMIEMSGSHAYFISRVLYMYNDLNPCNDFRLIPEESEMEAEHIISKPEYNDNS